MPTAHVATPRIYRVDRFRSHIGLGFSRPVTRVPPSCAEFVVVQPWTLTVTVGLTFQIRPNARCLHAEFVLRSTKARG